MGAKWSRKKKEKTNKDCCKRRAKKDRSYEVKKPVIYLYPENTMDIEVKLNLKTTNLLVFTQNSMEMIIHGKLKPHQMEQL